jgi:hypothetical protein
VLEDIWKYLRRASQETGASLGCASQATKLLRFRPYGARLVHEFKCFGASQWIQFFNWILKNVHDGLIDPQLLFVTDEAHFHLSSYVNSQNTQIWSDENPHVVRHIVLHDIKIGIWCAVSPRQIIGPVCHEILNLDSYGRNIFEPFFEQLIDGERQYGNFQQDSAAVNAARNSVSVLQKV